MSLAPFASALGNHLWQSTLFAGAVGLLALALRPNCAQVRYKLWLIASLKFFVPFSLLIAVGSHLGSSPAPAAARVGLFFVEQIGRPFPAPVSLPHPLPAARSVANPVAILVFAVWVCGFMAVVLCWWGKWRRIRLAVRAGSPLNLGVQVQVWSSPALVEPGVFGIFASVLLLPKGIIECLPPAQLEAILAHELCHIRRRDNLTAAIHMLVEAIFWFHPLVWWLGARLVEERERACDEEVLRLGSRPEVYAASILRICQFYLESPLACMAGVTGSDLKKRIVRIMTPRPASELSFSRKLLLAVVGMATVAGPLVFGLMNAPAGRAQLPTVADTPPLSFLAASIKPNRGGGRAVTLDFEPGGTFVAHNVTLTLLLEWAYGVRDPQISGGPDWINSERYDIEAKVDNAASDDRRRLGAEQRMRTIGSLLVDRFKLTLRHATRELPVYALLVAKSGPKFHETSVMPADLAPLPPPDPPVGPPPKGSVVMRATGQLAVNGAPLGGMFIDALSRQLGRVVLDKTGLKGNYEFTLNWTPAGSHAQTSQAAGPSIFTALEEQLGLRLESENDPVDTLVIDHVEKPSEN